VDGEEEGGERDATLVSDLLITGGSHARSCEFCFVSAWSDSLST
jgi:hypothetical protein